MRDWTDEAETFRKAFCLDSAIYRIPFICL